MTIPLKFNSGFTATLLHAGNGMLKSAWLFGAFAICSLEVYTTKYCSPVPLFKKQGVG